MPNVVGYIISRSTPRKVNFVIKRGERVELGKFYAIEHPFWREGGGIVLLRVYDISSMNEEMDLGRTGVIASSAGLVPVFQGELEYLIAYAEVLGYRNPIDGRIKGLEIPPSTAEPVFRPDKEDLREFFSSKASGYKVPIGKLADSDIDFYLDLDSLARGHTFVAGMTRSGKSVSGDSVTVIYDTRERRVIVCPIKDFVDDLMDRKTGTKELDRRYYALCLEKRSFRPTWSRITAVHKHKPPKSMYEIRTDKGKSLFVTGDHSLLVFDGLKLRKATPTQLRKVPFWLISPMKTPPPVRREDGISPELLAAIAADGSLIGDDIVIHAPNGRLLELVKREGLQARTFGDYLLLKDQKLRRIAEQGLAYFRSLPLNEERRAIMEFLARTSYQSHDGMRVLFSPSPDTMKVVCSLSLLGLEPEMVGPSWVLFNEKKIRRALGDTASDGGSLFHDLPELGEVIKRERIRRGMWRHELAAKVGATPESIRKMEEGDFTNVRDVMAVLRFFGGYQAVKFLTNPHISFERIVRVRKVKKKEDEPVYDLSVEKWENFVANGFFVHNSTFVLNLIENSQKMRPRPRFLVLDRRGEYSILARRGGVIFDYRTFLPKQGALTPKDISRRLGIERGSLRSLVELAAEEVLGEGEISPEALLKKAKELAIVMDVRERKKLINQLQIKLRRSGRFLRPRGMGQDIIEAVKRFPVVVLDFSIDADYEDQFLAVRDMIRKIVGYAISRRQKGDFALLVVLEEAQYLIPERNAPLVGNPFDSGVYSTMIEAISQSGGYNVGFIVVTQRPAYVSKAVISQCNTIVCFRLKNLNDQEAIAAYTEGGGEIKNYLSSLGNHEAMIWGMASEIPFPVTVRMKPRIFPAKASAPPSVAWKKMAES